MNLKPLIDGSGKIWHPYECIYKFDGKEWLIIIHATFREEAEMKMKAIGKGVIGDVIQAVVADTDKCPECGRDYDGSKEL